MIFQIFFQCWPPWPGIVTFDCLGFSQQCKPIINNSVLPIFRFLTDKRMDDVTIENDEIISLIRKINPNKATGSVGISGQMLLICDESVILPLQIIFTNILSTSILICGNLLMRLRSLKKAINN